MSKTILPIPFTYRIDGVRPRHSNVETFHVLDTIMVEVESVSSRDAPVVVEAVRTSRSYDRFAIRSYEDTLYGEISVGGLLPVDAKETVIQYGETRIPLDASGFAEAMRSVAEGTHKFKMHNFPFPIKKSSCGFSPRLTPSSLKLRSISYTDEDEARAAAIAAAEKAFLLIDGVLHAREMEPVWGIEVRPMRMEPPQIGIKIYRDADMLPGDVYEMDRLGDARKVAIEIAQQMKGTVVDESINCTIADRAWQKDGDALCGRAWLLNVLAHMIDRGSDVMVSSDEIIDAYQAMRQLVRSGRQTRLDEVHAKVMALDALISKETRMHHEFHARWKYIRDRFAHRIKTIGFAPPKLDIEAVEYLSDIKLAL